MIRLTEHVQKTLAIEKTTCDLCGAQTWGPEWTEGSSCHAEAVTVSKVHGASYDVWTELDAEEFDVCPQCWESKIKPLFPNPPRIKENGRYKTPKPVPASDTPKES